MVDDDIAKKVRSMSESELDKEVLSFDDDNILNIYVRGLEICYSRSLCAILGINYCDIKRVDYRRACVAAIYEKKGDKYGSKKD